jgi:hypothetical protein
LRARLGAAATLAALILGSVVTAQSASADVLPTGSDDRTFTGSQGGWTGATAYDGVCIPSVTCPTITNGFAATGGSDGASDGYLRTQLSSLLTTFLGTSTGTLESPAFTYDGNGGRTPARAEVSLRVRPQVSALLGLDLGNQIDYRVDLVDQADDLVVPAVPATQLTANADWGSPVTATVAPSSLVRGHQYKIRITTSYTTVLGLVASGEVGFDDVALTTTGGTTKPHTPSTHHALTNHQLTVMTRRVMLPASAHWRHHTAALRVACAKAAPQACAMRLVGLAKGPHSRAATKATSVRLKPGTSKVVRLVVKPRYVAHIRHAKRIVVRSTVRVGKAHAVVTKRVRLR